MAEPKDQQRGNIMDIIRGRRRNTATAAVPEELLTDADLAAIPEDAVDDGMTPILGQYHPPADVTFNPLGADLGGGGDRYAQTEEFQATPDDRALQGEGPAGRVTGNIISQGQAPDSVFAPQGDEFGDAWWNAPDEGPTREEAVSEAMFDFKAPSAWGGAGAYNYEFDPADDGTIGTIWAVDSRTGKRVKITPYTRGRANEDGTPGKVGGAWEAIMKERFQIGEQPVHNVVAGTPTPTNVGPELAPEPTPVTDGGPELGPNESLQVDYNDADNQELGPNESLQVDYNDADNQEPGYSEAPPPGEPDVQAVSEGEPPWLRAAMDKALGPDPEQEEAPMPTPTAELPPAPPPERQAGDIRIPRTGHGRGGDWFADTSPNDAIYGPQYKAARLRGDFGEARRIKAVKDAAATYEAEQLRMARARGEL